MATIAQRPPQTAARTNGHEPIEPVEPPPTSWELPLVDDWDASLVYDLLRRSDPPKGAPKIPRFVGREELLGSLENAISQPDRRGTYLISGYRGAGKTSLVIKAALNARPRLEKDKWRLLPLVLNVSEVSASLNTAGAMAMQPLGIDARRLLTALLRALRNELEDCRRSARWQFRRPLWSVKAKWRDRKLHPARRQIALAYDKAEASQYTRRAAQSQDESRIDRRVFTRSLRLANVLKLLAAAAVAAAAVVGVNGDWPSTVVAVTGGLAVVAVLSYSWARTITQQASRRSSAATELVFDNSLHQVETDLKQILEELHKRKLRPIIVLEELDKVEDRQGKQLDAVIRYFKNLFTQAPALFFFLTDKTYFDVVDAKLAKGRQEGSYAVEHTFFTHRVFVSRPTLDECLDYLEEVTDDSAAGAIREIRKTPHLRPRAFDGMDPIEQFLRVLLFRSQNHLFDLKSELRRYVEVVDGGRARLAFDERVFPKRDRGLAAFQLLLEQKLAKFWFGAGRDYANEILRNSLSAVFADIGSDKPKLFSELYPAETGQADLRREDRHDIELAIVELTRDLADGKAITMETSPESFLWRANAVLSFRPRQALRDDEWAFRAKLERWRRIAEQFTGSGPLAALDTGRAQVVAAGFRSQLEEFGKRELTIEEMRESDGAATGDLNLLLSPAHTAHRKRLEANGFVLESLGSDSSNFWLARTEHDGPSATPVLLVYGPDDVRDTSALGVRKRIGDGPVAAILIDDDPTATAARPAALLGQWQHWLTVAEDQPALVLVSSLCEDLPDPTHDDAWGERTTDELVFARLWLEQIDWSRAVSRTAEPAWLLRGADETRYEALEHLVKSWIGEPVDTVLLTLRDVGPPVDELVTVTAELATELDRAPTLLQPAPASTDTHPNALPTTKIQGKPVDRLLARRRLIAVDPPVTAGSVPAVVTNFVSTTLEVLIVRTNPAAAAIRTIADGLRRRGKPEAEAVYRLAKAAGDRPALAALARLMWDTDHAEARDLTEEYLHNADWTIRETSELAQIAAGAGDVHSMADLLVHGFDADKWQAELLQHADTEQLIEVAGRLGDADRDRSRVLLGGAAAQNDVDAMLAIVVSATSDADTDATVNAQRLIDREEWDRLATAASELDGKPPQLYRKIRGAVDAHKA